MEWKWGWDPWQPNGELLTVPSSAKTKGHGNGKGRLFDRVHNHLPTGILHGCHGDVASSQEGASWRRTINTTDPNPVSVCSQIPKTRIFC